MGVGLEPLPSNVYQIPSVNVQELECLRKSPSARFYLKLCLNAHTAENRCALETFWN